jgi:NTP pyrophosphatase (non-canonical NTP hydrolase)
MNLKTIVNFAKKEHKRLMNFYHFTDKKQLKHPAVLKVVEEVGELSEAVLANDSIQRVKKLNHRKFNVGHEITDVILTLFILAANMDVDVEKELRKGIGRRKKRRY